MIFIIIIFIPVYICAEKTNESNWSQPENWIQMKISTNKSEYKLYEPIIFSIFYRNIGKNDKNLQLGYHSNISTQIIITHNNTIVKYKGYMSGVGAKYSVLLTGTNNYRDRTGFSFYGKTYDLKKEYKIDKPGVYEINAIYSWLIEKENKTEKIETEKIIVTVSADTVLTFPITEEKNIFISVQLNPEEKENCNNFISKRKTSREKEAKIFMEKIYPRITKNCYLSKKVLVEILGEPDIENEEILQYIIGYKNNSENKLSFLISNENIVQLLFIDSDK